MNHYSFYLLIFLFVSCATKKEIIYNQGASHTIVNEPWEDTKIEIGDILSIRVSALNQESVEIFQPGQAANQNIQPEALKIKGYLVDSEGNIELPLLGSIKVKNKTTTEFEQYLLDRLNDYVKSPSVTVRLVNFKVTVLGEVNNPGTFTVLEERVTLPMILGTAGDLTINGDRKNVQIIRTQGDSLMRKTLDLTTEDFVNSPYYFLKQNDLIYISPNTAKVKSSGLVGNVGTLTSVISLLLTIILLTR
ncbi:polysaccharide export protein [Flavobacteriaceae bacterium]|nr:polysaccharide export protein [Flavobacteriaceae bacterium]